MISFISSPKPSGLSTEADLNQKIAAATWQSVADDVTYFGRPAEELKYKNVTVIESEEFPSIHSMAQLAANQLANSWVALLNADIRVAKTLLPAVIELEKRGMNAASSYRWTINNTTHCASGQCRTRPPEPQVVDPGLDFFIARPKVWYDITDKIPADLRMGSQLWDTWMLSYFATFQTEHYADLTPAKCVFHPKHEGRQYGPQPITPALWSHPVMSPNKIRL